MNFDLGDLMSVAAILTSVAALWRTEKYARTTDQLNKLLIEREREAAEAEDRPEVSANFVKISKNTWHLRIFNRGKAVARNVALEELEGGLINEGEIADKLPIPILERHQSVDLYASVFLGSASLRSHIKLTWENEAGKTFEKELTPFIS